MSNPKRFLGILTILLFALALSAVDAAPGDLDSSFAGSGKVKFGFGGGDDAAQAITTQGDGKIVVAGDSADLGVYRVFLARYNTDGSLDTSFGTNGLVFSPLLFSAKAVKIQADGKILVAGSDGNVAAVARFNGDGSVDSLFGSGGRALVPSGIGGVATGLALQSDNMIVVVANGLVTNGGTFDSKYYITRLKTDGTKDTGFNGTGFVEPPISAFAVAVSGSTIVVAGQKNGQFAVARHTATGALDSTFNNGAGFSVVPIGTSSGAQALAIQPATSIAQAKIVLGGSTTAVPSGNSPRNYNFALARFNSNDGTLDTSFDGDGIVITDVDPAADDQIHSLAVQNTGTANNPIYKIVAGGVTSSSTTARFVVARYLSGGSLDTTFDSDGIEFVPFSGVTNSCQGVALANGKIVAAGYRGSSQTSRDVAVARFNNDGSGDSSFDGNGLRSDDLGNAYPAIAKAVLMQPDGKIVVAGYTVENQAGTLQVGKLARLNPDGTFDNAFGPSGNGRASSPFLATFNAMALLPDGGLIVVGQMENQMVCFHFAADGASSSGRKFIIGNSSSVGNAVVLQPDGKILIAGTKDFADFVVMRLDASLNPDPAFGAFASNGVVVTDFGTGSDIARSMALQADGKIVVAGHTADSFAVARYNGDGSLDTTFSGDGKVTTPANAVAGGFNEGRSVAIQSDGKIVVTGDADLFATVRYNPDGSMDGGIARTSAGSNSGGDAVAIQPNGRIVVAGRGNADFAVVRYNANGSLDSSFSGDGKASIDFNGTTDAAHAMTFDANGRIVLAGESDSLFGVARLTGDAPTSLANISTRLRVLGGDNVLIAGMIATGSAPKKVIVRALGPTLSDLGVPGALTDPTLELFQGSVSLAFNDDWRASAQQNEIQASGVAPGKDAEAAIIAVLQPGQGYTAVVRGKNGQTGVGLVEVYDLDQASTSRLGNISTRGFVGSGDDVMIAGVIITPPDGFGAKILVRGLGPTLSDLGVPGALGNPMLDLVNSNGTVLRSNDDWKTSQAAAIQASGVAPPHDEESALIESVGPGQYTAVVRGANGGTGVGLVEVYNLP